MESTVSYTLLAILDGYRLSIFVFHLSIFVLLVEPVFKNSASVGWFAQDWYPINAMNEFRCNSCSCLLDIKVNSYYLII